MTIAAGFICRDGIVIAADTQVSGDMKSDAHKFEYTRTKSWIGAALGAGDEDYVVMCRQKFLQRFAPNVDAPCPDWDAVEDYALTLFDRHFAPLAIYGRDRPVAHMLLAIQPNSAKGALATWTGTAFTQRYPCAFVGIGAELATNINRKFLGAALMMQPMRQVAGVAIYVLSQVKAMVDGCGGQTELAMLGADGHAYYLSPRVIAEREHKYHYLDHGGMVRLADRIMEDCKEEDLEPI